MNAAPPLVSVVIPAFNAAATLADAVASVRRQQTGPLELIIVDDGSTDATASLARGLGDVRYLHQTNRGVAAARNAGLASATGSFIAWLDADDEWPDGSLALRLAALVARPDWEFVQGRTLAIPGSEGRMSPDGAHGSPWFGPCLASALFRRGVFDRVGPFDPSLRVAEDLDWFIRARELGVPAGRIDAVVLHYRLHAGSLTRGLDPVSKNLLLTVKRSLNRRRAAAPGEGAHE